MNENSVLITKALETTSAKLADNTTTNGEISQTLQAVAKNLHVHTEVPYSTDSDKGEQKVQENPGQNTDANLLVGISVSNRFTPLAESDADSDTRNKPQLKK